MAHNNKEWIKRSTSLIPAIVIHLPLLLDAIPTATNNNKATKVSSCGHITQTTLPQTPTAFTHATFTYNAQAISPIAHKILHKRRTMDRTLTEHEKKMSQTIPLSRIRATYEHTRNTTRRSHNFQFQTVYNCHIFISIGNMFLLYGPSTRPQMLSKCKTRIAGLRMCLMCALYHLSILCGKEK